MKGVWQNRLEFKTFKIAANQDGLFLFFNPSEGKKYRNCGINEHQNDPRTIIFEHHVGRNGQKKRGEQQYPVLSAEAVAFILCLKIVDEINDNQA